jgi:hypothetical protein
MNNFCTQCSEKLIDGSLYCQKCGAKQCAASAALDTEPDFLPDFDTESVSEPVDSPPPEPLPDSGAGSDAALPVQESQQESQQESPFREKKQSTAKKVLLTVASVFTSIALFTAVTAGASVFILQQTVNTRTVQTMASSLVDEFNIAEFTLPEIAGISIPGHESGAEAPLYELIYNTLHEHYIEEYGISESHVRELLEHEQFKAFVGGVVEKGVEYVVSGGNNEERIISSDGVVNLLRENAGQIEEISGFAFDEALFGQIRDSLRESGIDELTWGSAIGEFEAITEVRNTFDLVSRWSVPVLVISIAVAVALTVLIVLFNRRKLSRTLLYAGIPFAAAGIGFAVGGLITDLILTQVANQLGAPFGQILQNTFSQTSSIVLNTGLAVLLAGSAAIIAKVAVNVAAKRRV